MNALHLYYLSIELKKSNYKQCGIYVDKHYLNPINGTDSITLLPYCINALNKSCHKDAVGFIRKLQFNGINGKQLTMCIQCMYHIVNHFVTTDDMESIVMLKDILIGLSSTELETADQVNYYQSLCNIINNTTVKHIKCEKVDMVLMVQLINLVVRMSVKYIDNIVARVDYYIKGLILAQYNFEKILEVFVTFLKIPETVKLLRMERHFKSLISLLYDLTATKTLENMVYFINEVMLLIADVVRIPIGIVFKNFTNIFNIKNKFPCISWDVVVYTMNTLESSCVIDSLRPFMIPLCSLLYYFLYYFAKQMDNDKWVADMDNAILQRLLKFSLFLVEQLSHGRYTCCCQLKYDLRSTLKPFQYFGFILTKVTSAQLILQDEFYLNALSFYKYAIKHLKLAVDSNCKSFNELWTSICVLIYGITNKMYYNKHKLCYDYTRFLLASIFKLDKGDCNTNRGDITKNILLIYAELNYKADEHEKALALSAFSMQLFPKESELFWQQWLCFKSNQNVRRVTILEIVKQYSDWFKNLFPDYIPPNDSICVNLLLGELNTYKTKWQSLKSFYDVYKNLHKVASAEILAQAFMVIDLKHAIKMDSSILIIISDCIEKLEANKNHTDDIKVYLGYMYFLCYKYTMSKVILQNSEDMSNTIMPEGPDKINNIENITEDDVCDIVSSYNALKTGQHETIFKNMHLAFKNVSHLRECSKEFLIKNNFLEVIVEMAHEFKMHCYNKEYFYTWMLMYKVATILNDEYYILYAITYIYEHIHGDLKLFKQMQTRADVIISNIIRTPTVKLLLCTYYSNLGSVQLKIVSVDECKKSFELATEYYMDIKDLKCVESRMVITHYLLFQEQWYGLPCNYGLENHDDIVVNKSECGYKLLLYAVKSSDSSSARLVTALFEITEHALSINHWMRKPREMRAFGRDVVIMAQKLVVPFRTARLLLYLAMADLLQCRLEDCDVKLLGISDILALNQYSNKTKIKKSPLKESKQINDLVNGIDGMVIDEYRSTAQPRMNTVGSPTLYTEKFQLPPFISDHPNCNCLPCSCIEYKCLLLQKTHLEAQLSEYRDNINAAAEYYQGCFAIYNHLKSVQSVTDDVLAVYDNILVNFVKYKIRINDLKSAKILNSKMLAKHDKKPNKNYYIYNEIIILQLALLMEQESYYNYPSTDTLESPEVEQPDNVKTPENKCTRMNLLECVSPGTQHPNRRRRKVIPFAFNEPEFQAPKTPQLKFNIYTPSSTKTVKPTGSARKTVRHNIEDDLPTAKELEELTRQLTGRLKSDVKIPKVVVTDECDKVVQNKQTEAAAPTRVTRSAVGKKSCK